MRLILEHERRSTSLRLAIGVLLIATLQMCRVATQAAEHDSRATSGAQP